MKKIILNIILFSFCLIAFSQSSQSKKLFKFKHSKGDRIGIVSRVEEDVRINGRRQPHVTILNRISMEVTDVDEKGRGFYKADFMTSESLTDYGFFRSVDWDSFKNSSEYWRDENGHFEIEDLFFMPIIRDLPIFPNKEIEIGETWIEDGYEAEDFRSNFGISKPVKVPFSATYKYLRDENNFQVIQVRYNLAFDSPSPTDYYSDSPVSTLGYSDWLIWWDNEKGQIDHYVENFRITIESFRGNIYVFTGQSTSEVTEFVKAATDDNVKNVQEKVESLGLKDVSVTKTEQGLKIALENIQFLPDSAILIESEKKKIKEISNIISEFPNDILVSGHTASAGDEESCQVLSEERADSVASYMTEIGVRSRNHIFTEGFGSRKPIGDNTIEEGRKKNRRVEITILDK